MEAVNGSSGRRAGPLVAWVALALVTVTLTGCIGEGEDAVQQTVAPGAAWDPCTHPWPCGDGSEWPLDLEGPFDLLDIHHEQVSAHDGVVLDGYVYVPDLPEGVGAPVVLWTMPYYGQTGSNADSETRRESGTVPINELVAAGYAVAAFNVRGSGNSGGCFEMFGPNEQRDQATLVEWLADQPWSNGRIAMMGLSYHGTTPWEAAIQSPDALKTIVVAGMVSDLYTFYHTPQGAAFTIGGAFQTYFNGLVTFTPPVLGAVDGGPPERATTTWLGVAPERVCPEVARTMTALYQGEHVDERDADYWADRRLIDHFPNVTAAVLLTHGFQDQWGSGHQQQELAAWHALPATTPKHQLEGQWGHEFPNTNSYNDDWALDGWHGQAIAWFDFWLKGVGDPPAELGTVDYQDGTGAWRTSSAWPPAEAREEVVYLADDALAPSPASNARTFVSLRDHAGSTLADETTEGIPGPLCTHDAAEAVVPHGLLYLSEPLDEDIVLAGNPFAYLTLTSDQPGGLVTVTLFDLGPDFACQGLEPIDARPITTGTADLRFHAGNVHGTDFPTGTATPVRIDLTNLAERVEAGHRLAAFVSYGDPLLRTGQPYAPMLDVGGESHLVLPFVEGTLGGDAPTMDYPARPFVPQGAP